MSNRNSRPCHYPTPALEGSTIHPKLAARGSRVRQASLARGARVAARLAALTALASQSSDPGDTLCTSPHPRRIPAAAGEASDPAGYKLPA